MLASVQTLRLSLRPPLPSDLDAYFAVFGNAAANATNPRGVCIDRDAAGRALQGHIDRWTSDGFDVWAVSTRERPDRVIGFGGIGLRRFGDADRLNLGYGLHSDAFGRGYARELAQAGVAAARELASHGDLWARVHRDNAASRRVLEHAGLTLEADSGEGDELWYRLR
jgi:RimJ/RimL family protein N-acetyltransferase